MTQMSLIKIATWNVNSIRTRLLAVLGWLEKHHPHVLCLQETKVEDSQFPHDAFYGTGYEVIFTGQKGYNGMAMISSLPLTDVSFNFQENPDALQKRYLAATMSGVRLINIYIPNGSAVGTPQFDYKLNFIDKLRNHLKENHTPEMPLVLVGDFNVATEARDVYDPVTMDGEILFHPQERAMLAHLREWGLVDLFRLHHEESGQYTWWDYRMNAFQRNMGLRIDHIWATSQIANRCTACDIDKTPRTQEKPSDHAPVVAIFETPT
jgi:exodeoxyribonuclease-3